MIMVVADARQHSIEYCARPNVARLDQHLLGAFGIGHCVDLVFTIIHWHHHPLSTHDFPTLPTTTIAEKLHRRLICCAVTAFSGRQYGGQHV